jgi:putative metallopeptidase
MPRRPKPKKVSYELIPRDSEIGTPMYWLLDELIEQHHDDLQTAKIALAWCTSWKPDVDGHVTIGRCMKASDLHRELADFDFIVLLSRAFWRSSLVTPLQRRALLDHELCHAAPKFDTSGEPVEDERGRRVWRSRKHDIEEFTCIVQRYGCYKADLEAFAKALRIAPEPFTGCEVCRDTPQPGWIDVGDGALKRCDCYSEYQAVRQELATQ